MKLHVHPPTQVCWIPIFKARKLILAGDPMQLPPTIISIDKEKKKRRAKKAKGEPKPTGNQTGRGLPKPKASFKFADGDQNVEDTLSPSEKDTNDSGSEVYGEEEMKPETPIFRKSILQLPRTLETTLFDRLEQMYGTHIKRMLEIQYRRVLYLSDSNSRIK